MKYLELKSKLIYFVSTLKKEELDFIEWNSSYSLEESLFDQIDWKWKQTLTQEERCKWEKFMDDDTRFNEFCHIVNKKVYDFTCKTEYQVWVMADTPNRYHPNEKQIMATESIDVAKWFIDNYQFTLEPNMVVRLEKVMIDRYGNETCVDVIIEDSNC